MGLADWALVAAFDFALSKIPTSGNPGQKWGTQFQFFCPYCTKDAGFTFVKPAV
jgi:hypothetical protein